MADPKLCSLLEKEYYLVKVLEHVVEDGLHECRRVCRKWYDVCRRLPVKLRHLNEIDKLALACEMFPNATSVSTVASMDNNYKVIDRLGSMGHLRHLDIQLSGEIELIALNSFPQSFRRLESLCLWNWYGKASVDLGSSLQFLTNLTKLVLCMSDNSKLLMEPVTQLSKLKELHLVSVPLVNKEKQLLFQPLTGLTSLHLAPGPMSGAMQERLLQIVQSEAMQLQQLAFLSCPHVREVPNWSILSSFSHLESLELTFSGPSLRRALTNMCRLTQLTMPHESGHQHEDWEAVLPLTGLRSLCFHGQGMGFGEERFALHSLYRLLLLTSLTVYFVSPGVSLSSLTNLVELSLRLQRCPLIEIQEALVHLSNLERLTLSEISITGANFDSGAFAQLKKLRHVDLCDLRLDDNFIPTLASLPDLTSLGFIECRMQEEYVPSNFTQLHLLSNLRRLYFTVNSPYLSKTKPCSYLPEGSLPKLRTLSIACEEMTNNDERELFRRLPSLRCFYRQSPAMPF